MYSNANLTAHLQSSSTVEIEAAAFAEINLNIADNINTIGNYSNRPTAELAYTVKSTFVAETASTSNKAYYGYTDSDIVVDGGVDTTDNPVSFISNDTKKKLLYSLEDCFLRFRPRSGINKALFFGTSTGHYLHSTNSSMMSRPRYYMSHKNDKFKYWSSFRNSSELVSGNEYHSVERGIAKAKVSEKNEWYIDDAAPFIVYNSPIPTNRIIIKMQTHVGTKQLADYFDGNSSVSDPFYDAENTISNRTVPISWKVQYLDANGLNWRDAIVFSSADNSSAPLIGRDGYLELQYKPAGVGETYDWHVGETTPTSSSTYLTELVSPTVKDLNAGKYNQFQYIRGLRVVVSTMSKKDSAFELIELSPRLAADLSAITTSYSLNKIASDLGSSGLPVGQLLASTGSIELADYDQALNLNNLIGYSHNGTTASVSNPGGSVIAQYFEKNVQIKFYEIIKNVKIAENTTSSFYVPIKTMYLDGFPELDKDSRIGNVSLRDLFFYFETLTAPELFIKDCSFSYAVAMLLDSIGFSNYVYLKSDSDEEPQIPFFYSSPNSTVAEILNKLAQSTQTAVFFDENNNLVFMSRSYMIPEPGDRLGLANAANEINTVLYGSDNPTSNAISDVISVSEQTKDIYNDGKITYTSRYIQKSYTEIRQAQLVDDGKVWRYKPALLWEVAPTETTKSINEEKTSQSAYSLSAMPLNSNLSDALPTVSGGVVINNIIDFGEGIYWISRYNGYFYSKGEIIRYDAVEYSIPNQNPSNVWVSSQEEYQKYFATIPFGGKMYPTGRVRIYTEPKYNSDGSFKEGAVAKHGRGQFNTTVASHTSGLDTYWTSNSNMGGILMDSTSLFSTELLTGKLEIKIGASALAGQNKITIASSSRSSVFASTDKKYMRIIGIGSTANAFAIDTRISSFDSSTGIATLSKNLLSNVANNAVVRATVYSVDETSDPNLTYYKDVVFNVAAGKSTETDNLAKQSNRSSIIRNFLSSNYVSEDTLKGLTATQSGTIQSSALVMTGPTCPVGSNPLDYVSYIYKKHETDYQHFGTRLRILGTPSNDAINYQVPTGSAPMYSVLSENSDSDTKISGSSGGLGIWINEARNTGYYFEIAALTAANVEQYSQSDLLANIFFYKVGSKTGLTSAVPVPLWSGLTKVLVDDGKFTGQYRLKAQENVTVYDLAVEYEILTSGYVKFYLYINNSLVGTVQDPEPLSKTNTMGIFVRGESRLMFENIFAVGSTGAQYYSDAPLRSAINFNEESDTDLSLRQYTMPSSVSSAYMSGLSPISPPSKDIFFDEFGTIMRECAYFNIKYDKAYPALISRIAPTFNKLKGYTVCGYSAGAYGAEFLLFNNTDTTISLDETTGNYLRILGITFTQESKHELTVDDYFVANSDFSNIDENYNGNTAQAYKETYSKVKNSQLTYGRNEFNIDAEYIQDQDSAKSLMGWLSKKILGKRKSLGVEIFANPTIQLGDIVTLNYKRNGMDQVSSETTRFVVYNIDYKRNGDGPSMTLYLSEVTNA